MGSGVVVLVGEDVGECAHGGVGEIAAFTVLPFLVLFEEDCADKAVCGLTVGEDLDDVGAALDFAVEPLDGVLDQTFCQCSRGRVAKAVRSAWASMRIWAIWGKERARESVTARYWAVTALVRGLSEGRGDQGVHGLGVG